MGKAECKERGGASVCQHNRLTAKCKDCRGFRRYNPSCKECGKERTICLRSSIAAGSCVPDNIIIDLAASSHELDYAHPKYRKYT